ncbi:MAG TPA: GreA/GreB family elongation factor [Microbacterium sp.]|jgi:transcription elongation factor GreA|nr:GreA/GreB family elongation factor [Microbacterium sp.]
MTNATEPVWMTRTTLASLEAELAELSDPRRGESAADQVRIIELRRLIGNAEVGSKPDDGLVEPGMTVTVRFESDGSTETFLLGTRDMLAKDATIDVDVYTESSPLGAAITGRYVGDSVTFSAPNGSTIEVTVLAAVPFG